MEFLCGRDLGGEGQIRGLGVLGIEDRGEEDGWASKDGHSPSGHGGLPSPPCCQLTSWPCDCWET